MPTRSGPETQRDLRAAAPGLPIVVLSGDVGGSECRAMLEGGAVEALQKPFLISALHGVLARLEPLVLARRRACQGLTPQTPAASTSTATPPPVPPDCEDADSPEAIAAASFGILINTRATSRHSSTRVSTSPDDSPVAANRTPTHTPCMSEAASLDNGDDGPIDQGYGGGSLDFAPMGAGNVNPQSGDVTAAQPQGGIGGVVGDRDFDSAAVPPMALEPSQLRLPALLRPTAFTGDDGALPSSGGGRDAKPLVAPPGRMMQGGEGYTSTTTTSSTSSGSDDDGCDEAGMLDCRERLRTANSRQPSASSPQRPNNPGPPSPRGDIMVAGAGTVGTAGTAAASFVALGATETATPAEDRPRRDGPLGDSDATAGSSSMDAGIRLDRRRRHHRHHGHHHRDRAAQSGASSGGWSTPDGSSVMAEAAEGVVPTRTILLVGRARLHNERGGEE